MDSEQQFCLSNAILAMSGPPVVLARKWAEDYVPQPGRPLLNMSQGIPGIPPPPFVLEALGKAASDPNFCGYSPVKGEYSLRVALAQEMRSVYGEDSDIGPEDLMISAGCNMAFASIMITLADAGDEVILPTPSYFCHDMTLRMLVDDCAKLITAKTKAVVMCTPNNPTGALYPQSLIEDFALLAKHHNIALIVDETYRDFILDEKPHQLFTSSPRQSTPRLPSDWDWRSHFIHMFSFSKSYCIPGSRLGAIAASRYVLDKVETVLDCLAICAPKHAQIAMPPLLSELRPFIKETAQALASRQELFKALLPEKWRIGSQGAYFAFVKHPFKGISATDVCRRLASEIGVITLPGEFFAPMSGNKEDKPEGIDDWIRFSVANVDDERIKQVCERLREAEEKLGWAMN